MYAEMIIGEAISGEQVKEFERIFHADVLPDLHREKGFQGAQLLTEDDGRMAVTLTTWATREDCLRYHASRAYRQFVAKTQHLLFGEFVVKLFAVADQSEEPNPKMIIYLEGGQVDDIVASVPTDVKVVRKHSGTVTDYEAIDTVNADQVKRTWANPGEQYQ